MVSPTVEYSAALAAKSIVNSRAAGASLNKGKDVSIKTSVESYFPTSFKTERLGLNVSDVFVEDNVEINFPALGAPAGITPLCHASKEASEDSSRYSIPIANWIGPPGMLNLSNSPVT